jgi:hypothetical protein
MTRVSPCFILTGILMQTKCVYGSYHFLVQSLYLLFLIKLDHSWFQYEQLLCASLINAGISIWTGVIAPHAAKTVSSTPVAAASKASATVPTEKLAQLLPAGCFKFGLAVAHDEKFVVLSDCISHNVRMYRNDPAVSDLHNCVG